MSGALIVIAAGLSTTVQDEGRFGAQRFGVPVSGALDRVALAAANMVVGNLPGDAGLECLYQGPTLEVAVERIRAAVGGAGAMLEIEGAGGRRVAACESVTLTAGQRVRVLLSGRGISAYLAVAGGIAVPMVLGSRSTYVRAGIGGFEGRALRAGDRLPIAATSAATGGETRLDGIDLAPAQVVHVVPGPQADRFTVRAHETLLQSVYTVQPASDRMGLRLEGERLEHVAGADIVSDAIAPGSIQVPGDGRPIIMLADRQTTGGYTKIATVCSADLPALGRVGPGAQLRFRAITAAEAEERRRALDRSMAAWPQLVRPIATTANDGSLMSANLVSGVVNAAGDPDDILPGRS